MPSSQDPFKARRAVGGGRGAHFAQKNAVVREARAAHRHIFAPPRHAFVPLFRIEEQDLRYAAGSGAAEHRRHGAVFCQRGGIDIGDKPFPRGIAGITAVWAKENTREAVFDALKKRRCYGFMGGRMTVDFRISGHYMGEEITVDGDPEIYYNVTADAPVANVTLVKNCRDYISVKSSEQLIYDYRQETEADCYYLRVKLTDGRQAWTSPIWVSRS